MPKSKSSGAILQELPSPSWGGGSNTATGVWRPHDVSRISAAARIRPGLIVSIFVFCVCSGGPGRSELDELQEEVARRARQQEQQKRREAEREAAMGFNPKPSKYMDLDQLQHQGMLTKRGLEGETERDKWEGERWKEKGDVGG